MTNSPRRNHTVAGAFLALLWTLAASSPALAAQYGNVDAAHARFIPSEGSAVSDNLTDTNPSTWFTFDVYHTHSYAIEILATQQNITQTANLVCGTLFESDGTTPVNNVSDLGTAQPALRDPSIVGGDRLTFDNSSFDNPPSSTRLITLQVSACGAAFSGATTVSFHVRVIDTTLVAARWSVNGYRMQTALHNNSDTSHAVGAIVYMGEDGTFLAADPFDLPPNGSAQIVRPIATPIAGRLFGGARITFVKGVPGQFDAREYLFNPVSGALLAFPYERVNLR